MDDDEIPAADAAAPDSVATTLAPPRHYAHVTKAIFERPWAMQPAMLSMIADLIQLRGDGGLLSDAAIAERLAAAADANGDRAGGATLEGVAIIPFYGVMSQRQSLMGATSGGTSIDELRSELHGALADPSVKAVLFDIDSPGGSVDGVTEFATELRKLRGGAKPIVGQVNTMAASAAYWLAAQMDEIVVTPSGSVGSIGIFGVHQDVSKAAEMAGIKTTLISSGKYKVEGNKFEPLTDTARAALQENADAFYAMFVGDVALGRNVTVDQVEAKYGEGREVLATPALAAGMVDRIDTLEATFNRVRLGVNRPAGRRVALAAVPAMAAVAAGVPRRRVARDEFPVLLAKETRR